MTTRKAPFWVVLCFSAISLGLLGCAGAPPVRVFLTPGAPQTIDQGQTLNLAATAPADTTNSGVTWSISPATGAGTLMNTTTTSATYAAPASVTSATTVTITATSVHSANRSSSLAVTVEPPPTIPATNLPSGNQGSAYTATVSAAGGFAPYIFSVASGSLPAGLSLAASSGSSVTISGTPTALGTSTFTLRVTDGGGLSGVSPTLSIAINQALPLQITTTALPNGTINTAYPATTLQATGGIQPYKWTVTTGTLPPGLSLATNGTISGTPTTAGTSNFTVQVTDSATPTANTKTANLSITISASTPLQGNFAFEFSGNDSSGLVVAAGSFTADGQGHITNGVEDFNTVGGRRFLAQSFTGSYILGADNRGTLTLNLQQGTTIYAFSMDSTVSHGRLIEFDSTSTRGSGEIEKQSLTTCSTTTLNTTYALGMSGFISAVSGLSPGPVVLAGSFLADGGGHFSTGEVDANLAGTPSSVLGFGFSGSIAAGSSPASCTLSTVALTTGSMNLSAYPVSASEFFLVETDAINAATPTILSGKLLQQFGAPFAGASALNANSVAALTGQVFTSSNGSFVPDVLVAQISFPGNNNFSLTDTENENGSVLTNVNNTGTFAIDQVGRVQFSGGTGTFNFVMYIINANQAFFVTTSTNSSGNANPLLGEFDPQSSTTLPASATFVEGTLPSGTLTTPDYSGFFTVTGTAVTGTQDTSKSAGNTSGQAITGTLSNLDTSIGSGDYTQSAPTNLNGFFYTVSPTKFVMVTTTPGDPNPVVIVFGN